MASHARKVSGAFEKQGPDCFLLLLCHPSVLLIFCKNCAKLRVSTVAFTQHQEEDQTLTSFWRFFEDKILELEKVAQLFQVAIRFNPLHQ